MTTTKVPFRDGLLTLEPLRLIGGRCADCDERMFPLRSVCPNCRSASAPVPTELSVHGVVHTFTIVRQAPPGVATPYALAQVDLADNVRVLSQVDVGEPAEMEVGMAVHLVERRMGTSDAGAELIGYQFAPTPKEHGQDA